MQPVILQKPEIMLVGMSFYGDPFDTSGVWTEENHIGRCAGYIAHPSEYLGNGNSMSLKIGYLRANPGTDLELAA